MALRSNDTPLHIAIPAQLAGQVSLDRAAPAIFLLSHDAFDPAALRAAAAVYADANILGAGILVQCLHEEAAAREAHSTASDLRAA